MCYRGEARACVVMCYNRSKIKKEKEVHTMCWCLFGAKRKQGKKLSRLLAGYKCWYCALFAYSGGSFCVSFIFSLRKTGHSFRAQLVNINTQNLHRATI